MSTSKHTPGPWHSVWSPINKEHTISSRGRWDSLAVVVVNGNEDDELDAQGAANAALIAAAPDLLEALELACREAWWSEEDHLGGPPGDCPQRLSRILHAARAAIAKARGES